MTHNNQQLNLRTAPAVLLLDDNAIQAATRQTILKRSGYFVIAALNPVRALEQFLVHNHGTLDHSLALHG